MAPTKGHKVLLVDDSRTVLCVLRAYLMGHGFEFIEAPDGETALRLIMRERPAVVISDVEMPRIDGLDLCRAIRAAPVLRDTRVVLISSKWTPERQLGAKQAGVDIRLDKPVDAQRLARLVSRWLT